VDYARRTWPGRRIFLYGVSMGSVAVLRAVAANDVEADALILESPFDRLLSAVGNRFASMGLPPFPASELLVFWGSVQQGFNGFEHNPADYAREVESPTLLMRGEHDPRVAPWEITNIMSNLPGRKEAVTFPGSSHELLSAASPDLWKERVGRFLSAP
jgi:alpha-beta hydrolase superfamily lysophospholipase